MADDRGYTVRAALKNICTNARDRPTLRARQERRVEGAPQQDQNETACSPQQGAAAAGWALRYARFEVIDVPGASAELVSSRYRLSAVFGERVRWLPPHRLVPSFASADGQAVVYRRRSQVLLSEASDNSAVTQATSYAIGTAGYRVRIDEFGYARIVRPARVQQRVDPLTHLADGASEMEQEAAQSVCKHLNQHVDAIAWPHRWTPSPTVQLIPSAGRAFPEAPPEPPRPGDIPNRKGESRAAANVVNAYLDARAAWLRRRFAWENTQRATKERSERAAAGEPRAMQEHLLACLQDVLWPAPVHASYEFRGSEDVCFDLRIPGLDDLPDREATMTYGSRVAVQPMRDVRRDQMHRRHSFGLVLRVIGEAFAALPSIRRVTISAFQVPSGQRPRYVISAMAERKAWSLLYAEKWVTDESPERALKALGARYDVNGLGALLPIEPFG